MEKLGFGLVNDTDKSLQSKGGGGIFGLNTGNITVFEFNDHAGRDNTEGNAVDITFMLGDKEYRRRIYEITRVYGRNGEITDEDSEEYIKAYNNLLIQNLAVLTHVAKALGVSQTAIENKFKENAKSFEDWCKKLLSLVPSGYRDIQVDCFLEYQWTIAPGQEMTYLELPKNMKGGAFLVTSAKYVGEWKEQREWTEKDGNGNEVNKTGLRYTDNAGNVHPFIRNKSFMESNKAKQQKESELPFSSTTSGKTGWE